MSTQWLQIKAGRKAYERIQESGFNASDIELVLGASGGPKWFVLQGLDRFLFGDFFHRTERSIKLLGTSAGGWRFASLGQLDPVAASDLFARLYSHQTYSDKPDIAEITREAKKLLAEYVPDTAVQQIIHQGKFLHHMIVARCQGLTAVENKLQALGLLTSAAANTLKREWLGKFYQRVVFHHPQSDAAFTERWCDLPTIKVPLSTDNFQDALLATGSIPMVLDGVRDIAGAPAGMYRDGGITDYHFDLDLTGIDDLVLYPHFHREVVPGWFDKHIKSRRTTGKHWPNVIFMAPTREFTESLPYGKIPDRKDFANIPAAERIQYWTHSIKQGQRLAEQLHEWIESGKIREKVQLWT